VTQALLYLILVFREPGPKWHPEEGEPLPKDKAQAEVRRHWTEGRKARMEPFKSNEDFLNSFKK